MGPRKSSPEVMLGEKLISFNYQLPIPMPEWQGVGKVNGIKKRLDVPGISGKE